MASKLKRGDIVQYHNTGSCARLNGAVGVVRAVTSLPYAGIVCLVTWMVAFGEWEDNRFYGHGVLRKVADGENKV